MITIILLALLVIVLWGMDNQDPIKALALIALIIAFIINLVRLN